MAVKLQLKFPKLLVFQLCKKDLEMKFTVLFFLFTFCAAVSSEVRAELTYMGGHSDVGVGFEDENLHLHIHAEGALSLFGGGTAPAGEYDPGDLLIGVPGPSIPRPAGAQWNFLAPNANDSVWFLPQGSDPNKPFLGMGTEELLAADGWTTALTWTFNSISPISGDTSAFALWQNDAFGNPVVFASSLVPTTAPTGINTWTQNAFSHDHFNLGFTGEGIYDVSLTISGTNAGGGAIAAGLYTDTASYRFVTGGAISSVPEPSSALMLGIAAFAGTCFRRRWSLAAK